MKTIACGLLILLSVVLLGCGRADNPATTPESAEALPATDIASPEVTPSATSRPTLPPPTATHAPDVVSASEWVFAADGEIFSSAATDGHLIYFGGLDYWVYALEPDTGEIAWRFETGDQVIASPIVANGIVYAGSMDGNLYALEAATGDVIWRREMGLPVLSVAVHEGVVYAGVATVDFDTGQIAGELVAMEARSGDELWEVPSDGLIVSRPALSGEVVYAAAGPVFLALRAADGRELWRREYAAIIQSSPIVVDGRVYVGGNDRSLHVLDTATGEELWTANAAGEVISSPAVDAGRVYFADTAGIVYALDSRDGDELWRFETGAAVISSPNLGEGILYIGSSDRNIYALDAANGDEVWSYPTQHAVWASPLVAGERVYVGSFDRHFYALDAAAPQMLVAAVPTATPLPPQPTPPAPAALPARASDGELPWWNDRVFYEVFVRSFFDSDGDGIGDLPGLTQKLDYLNDGDPTTTDDLGVTGLWLMPIAQSPSYHGYDVVDYFTIEEDYGTNRDFEVFLEAAHERGIAVIVDLVMNHTSSEHPWFLESRRPGNPYETWYIWEMMPTFWENPWGGPAWHQNGLRYYFGMFWSGMPDLNYEHGGPTEAMRGIAAYWLEDMDVDGFRLDAIRHLIENGEIQSNTPATHRWLESFNQYVHTVNPDMLAVGEVYDKTSEIAPYVDSAVDIAFEFSLAEAILDSVLIRNNAPLTRAWNDILAIYPEGQYAPFLTNHDQDRVMNRLRNDVGAAKVAATLYLTSPGVPFVYYGEEIGMAGAKPDERIRTPMQWDASATAGFTTANEPWEPLQREVETRNVAVQTGDLQSLLNHYRSLIQVRHAEQALRTGSMALVESSSPHIAAYLRYEGDEAVLVVVNLDREPVRDFTLSLDAGPLGSAVQAASLLGDAVVSAPVINAQGGFTSYAPVTELPPREELLIKLTP